MADPQHLPAVVVTLPAEIDMASVGQADQRLWLGHRSRRQGSDRRHDGDHVCDSSGIAMLIRAHRQAVANGTELRLVVRSAAVLRALALVRLDERLPVCPSLGQALAMAPQRHHA